MKTRVYVGRLSHRATEDDLDYKFGKYGRIRNIDLKRGYAFVVCDFFSFLFLFFFFFFSHRLFLSLGL